MRVFSNIQFETSVVPKKELIQTRRKISAKPQIQRFLFSGILALEMATVKIMSSNDLSKIKL